MIDFSKLLFLPLDIETPPDISSFLDSLEKTYYIEDSYRISPSIMLMDPTGKWQDIYTEIPEFVEWAETNLFNWTGKSQLVVIVTPPKKAMAPHIDCSPKKFNTWQHKFRHVFRGKTSSLRYITDEKYITVPDVEVPYVISGKWPHDMINDYDQTKYTLCLGAPWEPSKNDNQYMKLLTRSYEKYKEHYLSYENLNLPKNYANLFNKDRYQKEINLLQF